MLNDLLEDPSVGELTDAIAELSQNTHDAIRRQREHQRVRTRAQVSARPGNSSERHLRTFVGIAGDVSAGGCQVLFPEPIGVGDLFWLAFDRAALDVDPLLARCVRCRLVREDAFEAGFQFIQAIALPSTIRTAEFGDGAGASLDGP